MQDGDIIPNKPLEAIPGTLPPVTIHELPKEQFPSEVIPQDVSAHNFDITNEQGFQQMPDTLMIVSDPKRHVRQAESVDMSPSLPPTSKGQRPVHFANDEISNAIDPEIAGPVKSISGGESDVAGLSSVSMSSFDQLGSVSMIRSHNNQAAAEGDRPLEGAARLEASSDYRIHHTADLSSRKLGIDGHLVKRPPNEIDELPQGVLRETFLCDCHGDLQNNSIISQNTFLQTLEASMSNMLVEISARLQGESSPTNNDEKLSETPSHAVQCADSPQGKFDLAAPRLVEDLECADNRIAHLSKELQASKDRIATGPPPGNKPAKLDMALERTGCQVLHERANDDFEKSVIAKLTTLENYLEETRKAFADHGNTGSRVLHEPSNKEFEKSVIAKLTALENDLGETRKVFAGYITKMYAEVVRGFDLLTKTLSAKFQIPTEVIHCKFPASATHNSNNVLPASTTHPEMPAVPVGTPYSRSSTSLGLASPSATSVVARLSPKPAQSTTPICSVTPASLPSTPFTALPDPSQQLTGVEATSPTGTVAGTQCDLKLPPVQSPNDPQMSTGLACKQLEVSALNENVRLQKPAAVSCMTPSERDVEVAVTGKSEQGDKPIQDLDGATEDTPSDGMADLAENTTQAS
ncbi:hypothetical protein CVT26_012781 [Gymnopilus dilepis]|uniref:Uncharacterized protein n=1 Tax=Gymnopilus dilepis TaxID=231916 RepID=A0A409X456_9AGAR|nr:hypothetical protein CVT26_012781 [Gymnopilus dilepis]